ncbi:MAG: hypothetical protein ACK4K7_15060 [Allosphingosinicella sp.]|uniref:hypothetical protein n=1 Tax=Allosphingosinicella sp. TaxID=2823234 RepID=UPI00392E57BD
MIRHLLALPLLLAAAPAAATAGWSCRATAPVGVTLDIVAGTGSPGGLVGATLRDGAVRRSTFDGGLRIGQSWIDEHSLLLDLLDGAGGERVARLRVTVRGELGRRAPAGSLEYGGRIHRIACVPEG